MSMIDEALNKAEDSYGMDATPNDVVREFTQSLDRLEVAQMLAADRNLRENNYAGSAWEYWSESSQAEFLAQADAILFYIAGIG